MKRSLLSAALLAGVISANAQSVVKDINPGTTGSFPYRMAAFGKNLVFTANDGTNGYELMAERYQRYKFGIQHQPGSSK